jgi:hypothetical protein
MRCFAGLVTATIDEPRVGEGKSGIRWARLIREQIGLYEPDLVICCGVPVFSALQKIYGVPNSSRYHFQYKNGDEQFFFHLPDGTPVMDFLASSYANFKTVVASVAIE